MMNSGFGFQSWGAKRSPAPAPEQVGAALQQQQQPMMPTLELARPPRGGGMQAEMAVDGDATYDPTTEHSAANTRAAMEDAIRRAADLTTRPALKRPAAPNQAWQLATLGLDPLSIQLFTQTGDAAGGAE